jgi:hypothetical protein
MNECDPVALPADGRLVWSTLRHALVPDLPLAIHRAPSFHY